VESKVIYNCRLSEASWSPLSVSSKGALLRAAAGVGARAPLLARGTLQEQDVSRTKVPVGR